MASSYISPITLNNPTQSTDPQGPLAPLQKDKYDFQNLFYPSNLGSSGRGHYINFYINVQAASKYLQQNSYNVANQDTSQANANRNTDPQTASKILGLSRPTKRITQAISLYMPDTVNASYGYSWQETSLSDAVGPLLGEIQDVAGAVKSATDAYKNGGLGGAIKNLGMNKELQARIAGVAAGAIGGDAKTARDFLYFTGSKAVNPQLEVLFQGLDFRKFQFDFLFSPVDQNEADSIKNIIKAFKFHSAPELDDKNYGRYFIMPSEFDIQFVFNGQENSNIHKISTCVLEQVIVDYAPSGWTTHHDGMPVQTRMTLLFKEVEYMTKSRIDANY